ncbi:MAG: PEP-CTERM sorting domain-containing protein [Sphingomonas sp.]
MAIASALLMSGAAAHAQYRPPVPDNAYITIDGLDWAWALPYNAVQDPYFYSGIDLFYQGKLGWRFPTPEEFAIHPVLADFTFAGANGEAGLPPSISIIRYSGLYGVPTEDVACATAWFSNLDFCNWDQAFQGHWYDPAAPFESQYVYQTLVVRPHGFVPAGPVPEPGHWILLLIGFGILGAASRARYKVAGLLLSVTPQCRG